MKDRLSADSIVKDGAKLGNKKMMSDMTSVILSCHDRYLYAEFLSLSVLLITIVGLYFCTWKLSTSISS